MITYTIKAGSTDVSVVIRIVDSADGTPETGVVFNTAGIDLEYRRELAASTDITEATLAALTTAHADGGFLHIGNGYYRLDLPDAAVAAGATGCLVHGVVTGMVVIGCYIQLTTNTVDDVYTRIGAPAGASVSADIAAIEAQTDDIGVAGAGLTAVPWNAAWDAEVQSEVADGLAVFFTSSAALVDAIWDEPTSGHTTAGTTGWTNLLGVAQHIDTVLTGTPSSTEIQLTAGSTVDDFYNDQSVYIVGGTGVGQLRPIYDYVGATRTITVDEPFATTPANGDRVVILAAHVHPLTQVQNGLATSAAVADLPTNAELATALGTADDAVLAAIAALNNVSAAQVNAEVDTAIQDAFNFSNGNVNANVEEINTVTITGDGQVGTEFGVA